MAGLVIFVIGVGAIYSFLQVPAPYPLDAGSDLGAHGQISKSNQPTSNNYLEYTAQAFDSDKNKKRVLYFYANWCPTCRPADAEFNANVSKFPKDLVLFRVNYNDSDTDDTEKALAVKYGITYQHTFVQVDEKSNEIVKWNGGAFSKLISTIQ